MENREPKRQLQKNLNDKEYTSENSFKKNKGVYMAKIISTQIFSTLKL